MAQSLVKLTLESNQYERGIRQAQRSWNEFTKGIGVSASSFTKVSVAVAAVSGALKVAQDAFKANEVTMDEWGRTVESAQGLYNGFINSLNNANISGFLSKMDDIVTAARQAYDAMDELGTYNAFNQVQQAKSKAGYAQALDAYRLNPTAANKAILEAANKAVMSNLREQQSYTTSAYTAQLKNLGTQRGLSGQQLNDFIELFQNRSYAELKAAQASFKSGTFLNAGSQYYMGDRVYDGRIQDRGTGRWRDMTAEETKQFEFARALSQTTDDQIKAVQALGAQAETIGEAIYQQDRAYNRLAGNNAPLGGKGGKSGGGSGKSTSVKAELTEIQRNQAQINQLTREYVRLGDLSTESAAKRKDEIRTEISQLNSRNDKLKLYEEQAQGRLLGGKVDTSSFSKSVVMPGGVEGMRKQLEEEFAKNPIRLTVTTSESNIAEIGAETASTWKSAASAISAAGSAMQSIEDPSAKVAGIVMQAIATTAMAYSEALATDWTSKSNIWSFIAAAAASTASMIATIASIHSATGYAEGGIVRGRSYSGDNIYGGSGMLNAGELVLNKAQQGNLASQLNDGGGRTMNVVGRIRGNDILIALDRTLSVQGKGQLLTWK